MISILIISREGEGYEIAERLVREGHLVKLWSKHSVPGKGYKNPQTVSNYEPHLQSADLILFTSSGFGGLAQRFTKMGRLVLGGGLFHDLLTEDRAYELQVGGVMKVKIPRTFECSTPQEGLKLLDKIDYPINLKPLQGGVTIGSFDYENRMLRSYLEKCSVQDFQGLIMQEAIDGIEITTEGWFNGSDWIPPYNHSIKYQRLMEGDKGPNTGWMGSVMWFTDGDRVTRSVLEPITSLLRKVKYCGCASVELTIKEPHAYFLKCSVGLKEGDIAVFGESLVTSLSDLLYKVASGEVIELRVNRKFNIGVNLTIPWDSVRAVDVPKEASSHFWTSALRGKIGTVTAWGDTVREARRRVYRTIENVRLSYDVQYREDIGLSRRHNVEEQIRQLQQWGWL